MQFTFKINSFTVNCKQCVLNISDKRFIIVKKFLFLLLHLIPSFDSKFKFQSYKVRK